MGASELFDQFTDSTARNKMKNDMNSTNFGIKLNEHPSIVKKASE